MKRKDPLAVLAAQVADLQARLAVVERDCPHCVGARDRRAMEALQRPIQEAQQRRDEQRAAHMAAQAKANPPLAVGFAQNIVDIGESAVADELGLDRLNRTTVCLTSTWRALRKKYPDDVAFALAADGDFIVKPVVDDPSILEHFYGGFEAA